MPETNHDGSIIIHSSADVMQSCRAFFFLPFIWCCCFRLRDSCPFLISSSLVSSYWLTGGALGRSFDLRSRQQVSSILRRGEWDGGRSERAAAERTSPLPALESMSRMESSIEQWPRSIHRVRPAVFSSETREKWLLGSAIADGRDGFFYLLGQLSDEPQAGAGAATKHAFFTRISRDALTHHCWHTLELLTSIFLDDSASTRVVAVRVDVGFAWSCVLSVL